MDEPLFDQEFYDHFDHSARERLQDLAYTMKCFRDGTMTFPQVVEPARHVLHNIAGEARMLELGDVGTHAMRLGLRLGRMGAPARASMSPQACKHFMACCELLCSVVSARVKNDAGTLQLAQAALQQELQRLEQAAP